MITVLLADDHVLVRQGLKALLERGEMQIVAEVSDGEEAVRLATQIQPDVAVLDIGMPILNGLEAARSLRQACPKIKVVLLTRHDEDQYVTAALRAGIRGYVLKTQASTELVQAIHRVSRGEIYLSPGISRAVVDAYLAKDQKEGEILTPRERQVLQLVGEGKTTKEVAILLCISVKTAESHRSRLMQKLDIHETASLVRYAIRSGVVEP